MIDPDFRTIVKTRIIARHQQVVRVDREEIRAPGEKQVGEVTARVRAMLPQLDAFIFEDYGKGFLNPELVRQISADVKAAGKIVTADPKSASRCEMGPGHGGETKSERGAFSPPVSR